MKTHPSATTNPAYLFLALAILLGGYARLNQVLTSPFPLNDGGLFYAMTQDLQANQYSLPEKTSYNQLELPFAYPPLPFYLAGGLNDLTGWELLEFFRLLPAVFSILAIVAFYWLANDLAENRVHAGVATLIFALLPTTFDWLIMGGGLTRAPAFFFALLTLHRIYLLYTRRRTGDVLWTAVLASLTILSHPETALHTVISAVVFFFFLERSKSGLIKSLLVAGLVLGLTSPWWIPNLARHGLEPYLAAGSTGWHNFTALVQLFRFDLTNEYGLATIGVLALIGLFWQLANSQVFLPVWLLVIFLSEPRSAPLYITPILALTASYSLLRILRFFKPAKDATRVDSTSEIPLSSRAGRVLFALLFAQWTLSALVIPVIIAGTKTLSPADKTAFDWVTANTLPQARFLILTGDDPFSDPTSEWFPALTGRVSVATVQGYEWEAAQDFEQIKQRGRQVQECVQQTPACIKEWAANTGAEAGMEYDYILLRKLSGAGGWQLTPYDSGLEKLLVLEEHALPVYQTPEVVILKVASQP
ncbi:MAG TPA: 6-pyruvoyl-tetrahydropterin synthase-related protein [Anaerolineales bacterium]|nr:6-pyruvoyl-tetrahydropterin synthase-related protein [Anaerolineales bacterium]